METKQTNFPVLIAVLLLIGSFSVSNLWTNLFKSDWAQTEGTLVKCELGNGKYASDLILSYQFTVQNQVLYGNRADLSIMGKGYIPEALSGLKRGDKVTVYYDPDNPKKSSLSLEGDFWLTLLLLLASFSTAAVLIYKVYIRPKPI